LIKELALQDALSALLLLSGHEKEVRGLTDTPREIHQQPETWRGTWLRLASMRASIQDFLKSCGLATGSQNPPAVILAGAGTSDYIGRAVSRLLHQQWGCEVAAIPSTELLMSMDDLILPAKQYLLISFSRSGESSEGVAVLKQALERYPNSIRHLVITCNASSTMAKLPGVFTIVLDDAVNDRGLAMTSSFSNMVIAGQYLAYIRTLDRYEPLLQSLIGIGARLLPHAADTAALLAKKKFNRVCFLGAGALQAVAQECALKVLELNAGKVATLAESPLGLRHGPMSFLNKETLVVTYLSNNDYRQQYELDLLDEIRSKDLSGDILVIAPRMTDRIRKLAGHALVLDAPPTFPDTCRSPVDVIAGQLLALFFAIENGITPDTPSEGAISRVVSHVKIYSPNGVNKK
jgi:tagatose-6-phosphate ketose/aldose isomerase